MRPRTAPGAAERVAVSADGEVLACLSDPYAALDARRLPPEHLPPRNLISTLFELNGLEEGDDAEAPLRRLGTWLPDLGELVERVQAAYAEWLATVNETLYPGATAKALVERLTGADHEEDPMAVTVLEEQLQRRIRRERRDAKAVGVQRGIELGKQLCIELGMQRWYIEQGLADIRSLLGHGCPHRRPVGRDRRCRRSPSRRRVGDRLRNRRGAGSTARERQAVGTAPHLNKVPWRTVAISRPDKTPSNLGSVEEKRPGVQTGFLERIRYPHARPREDGALDLVRRLAGAAHVGADLGDAHSSSDTRESCPKSV